MRAFAFTALGDPPALRDDLPDPSPGAGGLLIRVHSSSVNPVDNAIAAGALDGMFEHEFPVVLGRDYAGSVQAAGAEASGFAPGDEVFGFVPHADPTVHDGSWADLIAVSADNAAAAPAGVDRAAAGAAPLAAITALAAVEALELEQGSTVLIVGATGGVGSYAVQLAAHAGATVIAPALPEDEDYLRGLGASELIDRDADIAAAVRERYPDGVDALLDVVSYDPDQFDEHAAALEQGGRAASPISAAGEEPGRANVMAVSSRENLERVGRLLADGALTVPIQASYGLGDAGEALQALAGSHTQGKLAIEIG